MELCSRVLPIHEPIYEFGSLQVPGQEGYADLRRFFPGRDYVGADVRDGPGVDIILNLHDIDLPAESVGTVLVLETLEHVERPWRAVVELHRVLKPGGVLIASSQMNYPIHNHPVDYWRFTPEAFRVLLKPFDQTHIDFAGESHFPHTVVGVGFKGSVAEDVLPGLRRECRLWRRQCRYPEETVLGKLITLVTPPLAANASRKIRGQDL